MALKQINETRRLQYELLKPEIDLYASPEGVVYQAGGLSMAKQLSLDAFKLVMNSEFKIRRKNSSIDNIESIVVGRKRSDLGFLSEHDLLMYLDFRQAIHFY
ncbi:hypothetical protein [Shimazuella kribbensis]|uniref:hypothetical protein n=1 Tax=Shimazuella kribbensis TaxID=139808 RepID=UPI000423A270|nr:hypothetical protein [Shimazuella kribbensis]